MGSSHTSGSSLASWPLKSQWTKARGQRRCGQAPNFDAQSLMVGLDRDVADDDNVDTSFGAMTIRYKYNSPQAWMTNNWGSYLIIHFGSPRRLSSTGLLSFLPSSAFLPNYLLFSSLGTIISTMLSSLLRPIIVLSRCSPTLVTLSSMILQEGTLPLLLL